MHVKKKKLYYTLLIALTLIFYGFIGGAGCAGLSGADLENSTLTEVNDTGEDEVGEDVEEEDQEAEEEVEDGEGEDEDEEEEETPEADVSCEDIVGDVSATAPTDEELVDAILNDNITGIDSGFTSFVLPDAVIIDGEGESVDSDDVTCEAEGLPEGVTFDSETCSVEETGSPDYDEVMDFTIVVSYCEVEVLSYGVVLNDADNDDISDSVENRYGGGELVNKNGLFMLSSSNSDSYLVSNRIVNGIVISESGLGLDFLTDDSSIDFDNDGVNNGDEIIAGTNLFVAPTNADTWNGAIYYGGDAATNIIAFDSNNDGYLDIMNEFTSGQANAVNYLSNDGDGTFTSGGMFLPNTNVSGLTAGDYNNDEYTDAVVSDSTSQLLQSLLSDGSHDFNSNISDGGIFPQLLITQDFDADGNLDIAGNNLNAESEIIINVSLGIGNGKFSAPIEGAATGLNYGEDSIENLVVGDFNKDGIMDIATLALYNEDYSTHGRLQIYTGIGDGTFTREDTNFESAEFPYKIAVADVDNDQNLDLVFVLNDGLGTINIGVFLGDGTGSFTHATDTATEIGTPTGMVVGDFDGDNYADVIVIEWNSVTVYLNNGDGTFTENDSFSTTGTAIGSIVTADFDADGALDIAVTSQNNDSIEVYLNK